MSNEAARHYGGSPQPTGGHRYHSQPSTPSSFAHNPPLQSRTLANNTTPTRPSPLSRMTLPDTTLRGDFPAIPPNVDDDVFSSPLQPPTMGLDPFSRFQSDPLANLLRNNAAANHHRQRQQTMHGASNRPPPPLINRPRLVRTSPSRRRPAFISPSFTMQQRQQMQYQHQLAREQQFRLQQQQNVQYHQQQHAVNLVSCTLCDTQFTVSSESIPPDEQGRAYCPACVGRVSGQVVSEQKAKVAAEEGEDEDEDGDVGPSDVPTGTRDDDDVTMGDTDEVAVAAQGTGEAIAQKFENQGSSVGGQEPWSLDFNNHGAGTGTGDLELDNAQIWDNWDQIMGQDQDLAHEELLHTDGQHMQTATKK